MKKRKSHFIYKLLIIILSALLLTGAYAKFTGSTETMYLFTRLHLVQFVKAFGIIELILLVTLWWRPTRMISTLIMSAYFGAGVIMLLSLNESPLAPFITLLIVWIIFRILGRGKTVIPGNYSEKENRKKEGEISINYDEKKSDRKGNDEGEYIDYEEIK